MDSFRFDLTGLPSRKGADLFFAHVCDTHVTDAQSARIVAAGVHELDALEPDFIMFGGDLVNAGDEAGFGAFEEALAGAHTPLHFVPGNHDGAWASDLFSRPLGPLNHAFDHGPLHIICLDSTGPTNVTYGGWFRAATVDWLEEHLETIPYDQPLVLFTHHGIRSQEPWAPLSNLLWDVINWRPVHRVLERHSLLLACAGHAHTNAREKWGDVTMLWSGVLSTVRANHVDLPPGFRLVWMRGNEVETRWVPLTGSA
jgi:3',5'-cyclic AMP phosphodiesterase CpdA